MRGVFERNDLSISAVQRNRMETYKPMFHSHAEIIYILSGETELTIDGIKKTLKSGGLSFAFPYSIHEYSGSSQLRTLTIMFRPEIASFFTSRLLSYKPEYPFVDDAEGVLPLLKKVVELANDSEGIHNETAKGYLCAAIGEILMNMELKNISNTDLSATQEILIYCSKNFKNDINVKDISKHLFISQSYISKIFTTKMGYSFREYINILRINEAMYLLKHTDMKIIDIMYECGFKNQSSFNRIFYSICSSTPSGYRKM